MTKGEIHYTVNDGTCVIRMEGRLTHTLGVAFGLFIERLFNDESVNAVIVDLSLTDYMDSTMLGLLGKLANRAQHARQQKVTLTAPSDNVQQLLSHIGFDDVFIIENDWCPLATNTQALPPAEASRDTQTRVVWNAHKLLMSLNETNAAQFKNVVELLDVEIRE